MARWWSDSWNSHLNLAINVLVPNAPSQLPQHSHRARHSLDRWPKRSGFTAATNPTWHPQRVFPLTYDWQQKRWHIAIFFKKIDAFWDQKVAATNVAKVRSAYTTQASPPFVHASHHAEIRKNKSKKTKSNMSRDAKSRSRAIGSIAPQLKASQKKRGPLEIVAFCLFSNIRSPV